MADRPILFSGPMVRALLAGRKTQTRRVLKIDTPTDADEVFYWPREGRAKVVARYGDNVAEEGIWARKASTNLDHDGDNHWGELANGYIRYLGRSRIEVGDRLWVRETWASLDRLTHNDPGTQALANNGFYAACQGTVEGEITRWTPAIHMPRRASRLTLAVTDVRVERLQDISEEDARAEGVESDSDGWRDYQMPHTQCCGSARDSYRSLWNSLNADRGYGWDANPWVVAVTFTVGKHNIDEAR